MILRFGTLYGLSPRMRFDLVINLFIAQAINEGKITVFGGQQYRPFLHVDDAAESILFSLEKNLTGTYNVISENLTIMEAANKISKITGCEIEVSHDNEDNRNYKVSDVKIRNCGFLPKKNIEVAIEEIKKAFQNGKIKDYKESRYSNYDLLYGSKEKQEKVFIHGL